MRAVRICEHQPSSFDRTETYVTTKLTRTHALFAGEHQMRDFEPVARRFIGVFEDSAGQVGETIAVYGASFALPVMTGSESVAFIIAATGRLRRSANARRPNWQCVQRPICSAISI